MRAVCLAVVFALLTGGGLAHAGVIDETAVHYPWVKSTSGTISYDAGTGRLDVISYPAMINRTGQPGGGIDLDPDVGYFELHAVIDPTARTVSAAESNLIVWGALLDDEDNTWTMFQSNRAAEFDYNFANNGQIALRFWQDGDMEAPNNANVVVQIWAVGATGFDSSLNGAELYTDTFHLPEPATLSLLALGGAAFLRRRRPRP